MVDEWTRDRARGWLGIGFVLLLLGSEGALTLPAEDASDSSVADFYTTHGTVIIVLQVVGFAACLLLAGFAWRHCPIDHRVPPPYGARRPVTDYQGMPENCHSPGKATHGEGQLSDIPW